MQIYKKYIIYNEVAVCLFITLFISFCACTNKSQEKKKQKTHVNSDKPQEIETIEVGKNNIWMKSWLSVTKFKNGDSILHCQDESSWNEACENRIPAYCTSADKTVFYYNMHCITDNRGIAPVGFKLPTMKEIEELLVANFIYHPKSPIFRGFDDPIWKFLTEIRTKSEFNLFPSGARLSSDNYDEIHNKTAYMWTRTTMIVDGKTGSCGYFFINVKDVYEGWDDRNTWDTWNQGFPILCLKGNSHDKNGKLIIEELHSSSSAQLIQ
jgi:uncharacterized protein (TIGR02145 family)